MNRIMVLGLALYFASLASAGVVRFSARHAKSGVRHSAHAAKKVAKVAAKALY